MTEQARSPDYFARHGLLPTTPAELNASLAVAIEMLGRAPRSDDARAELTAGERAALEAGGVDIDAVPGRDPFADSAVKYAALLETSLSTKEAAERLGFPENRVRQMIARRTLCSVLHDNRRYVLAYQFRRDGSLVPNIGRINAALDPELSPLSVHEFFVEPDAELFYDDDIDRVMSPIEWLESGGGVERLVRLTREHFCM